MQISDQELARRLQAEENNAAAAQLPSAYPIGGGYAVQAPRAGQIAVAVPVNDSDLPGGYGGPIGVVAVPVNDANFQGGYGHHVIQAQALPYNGEQHVIMQMPPMSGDEQRLLPIFKLSRIIQTFSLIDSFFIILWAMMLRFFPLLILAPLAICGYYAGRRFNRPLAICYLIYSVIYCVSVGLLVVYKKLWLLACINILIEIWIGRINLRFIKEIGLLTPADILTLQQSTTLAQSTHWTGIDSRGSPGYRQ
jgi:hypothetical protein